MFRPIFATLLLAACAGSAPTPATEAPPAAPTQAAPIEAAGDAAEADAWTCPMHPEVRETAPGQCPKCGMTLVKVEEHDHSAHEHGEDGKQDMEGMKHDDHAPGAEH